VNGDLTHNTKSRVIELGTYIVNVLRELDAKYYTVKALVAQYSLAVELKHHPFRTHVYTWVISKVLQMYIFSLKMNLFYKIHLRAFNVIFIVL
jgi:hypothetical protein